MTTVLLIGAVAFVVGNYTAYRAGRLYGHARGVADEKKRATIAKLGGKAEWTFRVATNNQYGSTSSVIYGLGPDGSEYVCNDYLAGINSIAARWIDVATGETVPSTEDTIISNRFYAWRTLQRTGAR